MINEESNFDSEEKYFEECLSNDRAKRLKEKIFEWCQKGDIYHLKKYINDKDTDINAEDSGSWTPIQWAVVNNQIEVLKIILNKLHPDKKEEEDEEEGDVEIPDKIKHIFNIKEEKKLNENETEDFDKIFKKPEVTNNNKYTPLHWAAYKGNRKACSILLKFKYNALDVDKYGNTALHQAAASNDYNVFKCLLGLGIDLDVKNARNHTPLDLTCNLEIQNLGSKIKRETNCKICRNHFSFFEKKCVCFISEDIICKQCCVGNYYYENEKSEFPEIFECRSKETIAHIKENEDMLNKIFTQRNLDNLKNHFNKIKNENIKIDPKLIVKAVAEIEKLERERKIYERIASLEKVVDHKTIEKSIFLLMEDIKEAVALGIKLDETVVKSSLLVNERKIAEKELRKLLSNVTVADSSEELKNELSEKIKLAQATGVDNSFTDVGNALLENICLHLQAIDTYNKLVNYPSRVYEIIDPNDKKKKKKPEPKKKKKKEAPFPTPEWALTSKEVKEKVDEYVKFTKMSDSLLLPSTYISKTKEILARFKLEIDHLKREEEEKRLLEEEKAKKAKKKKK